MEKEFELNGKPDELSEKGGQPSPTGRKSNFMRTKRNKMLFYILGMALPVAQFLVFYIGVNVNSLLLAFRSYSNTGGYAWVGFQNFIDFFHNWSEYSYYGYSLRNSLILLCATMLTTFIALIFSYFITKKFVGAGFFRTILFLPNICSVIVMVTMFNYFVENFIPEVLHMITGKTYPGLLSSGNMDQTLAVVLFYTVWAGFGTQILMYTGAMSGISESVVEAAELDGITPLKEFIYITIPMIWPTLTTFLVTNVAQTFINQMNLFSFFGTHAEYQLYTFGYYLYMNTQQGSLTDYPYLVAIGIFLTLICVPLTLGVRKVLEKFGPKAE